MKCLIQKRADKDKTQRQKNGNMTTESQKNKTKQKQNNSLHSDVTLAYHQKRKKSELLMASTAFVFFSTTAET